MSSPKPRSWRWRRPRPRRRSTRVRERMSRLLRRPGHLLCRPHERHRPHLSADLHRYLRQGGFAKLYDRKTPIAAAEILNDRVLPFFEEHGIALRRVLTDRGTEYCGNPEHHDYELYLAVEDIDHTRDQDQEPRRPTECSSASSRPACASGPMLAPTTLQKNVPPNCRDGFTAIIGTGLMAVSARCHPSADSL